MPSLCVLFLLRVHPLLGGVPVSVAPVFRVQAVERARGVGRRLAELVACLVGILLDLGGDARTRLIDLAAELVT